MFVTVLFIGNKGGREGMLSEDRYLNDLVFRIRKH